MRIECVLAVIVTLIIPICDATASYAQTSDEGAPGQIGTPVEPDANIVGAGGEFTHRIPINIPEFRDLPLSVSLRYNSSDISRAGVDRTVAQGWGLAAFSVIERKAVGGGVPTFDDGQDLYLIDGQELMACSGSGATNPWTLDYPLRYITDRPSASCGAGGNFTAQIEDFNRIVFDAAANTFTVTRPNGVRLIYTSMGILAGDTSAAGTPAKSYATKARWLLTRIEDAQATRNVVTYTYAFGPVADGYAHSLTRIDYAGYNVRFDYRTFAANAVARFATGTSVIGVQRKQLRTIRIYNGETAIRAYSLTHEASALTGTQLLKSVREYGSDFVMIGPDITGGSALPAVEFGYSADQASFFRATAANTPSLVGTEFHEHSTLVDLDHDGALEILQRAKSLSKRVRVSGTRDEYEDVVFYTYLARHYKIDRQRGVVTLPTLGFRDCIVLEKGNAESYTTAELNALPKDKDGAGPSAPFILGSDRSGAEHCMYRAKWVERSGMSSGGYTNEDDSLKFGTRRLDTTGALVEAYQFPTADSKIDYVFGNFDLDPFTEVRFETSIGQIVHGDVLPPASAQSLRLDGLKGGTEGSKGLRVFDFTGDGVDDFVGTADTYQPKARRSLPEAGKSSGVLRSAGYSTEVNISSSVVVMAWKDYHEGVGCGSCSKTFPGEFLGYADMNGDGVNDIVYHRHNTGSADSIVYFPAIGSDFGLRVTVPLPGNYMSGIRGLSAGRADEPSPVEHISSITDVNADGLPDIVLHAGFSERNDLETTGPYHSGKTWVLFGTGTGFVQIPIEGSMLGYLGMVAVGDLDGDGLADIVLEGANTPITPASGSYVNFSAAPGSILFGNGGIPNRLVSIKSELGGLTTISYAPSSEFGTNQMPGIQLVVKSIMTNDGRGNSSTVEYRYVGGRYDFVHRLTLGYKTVTAFLPPVAGEVEGPQIVTTYLNDHLAEYGLVKSRTVIQGGATLSREVFDYSILKVGNGPWRADRILERKATLFGAALVETTVQKEWNAYGQIVRETSLGFTADGVNLAPSDDVTVTYAFNPNLTAYITDKPKFSKAEAGLIATAAFTDDLSYTAFRYDGAADHATGMPVSGNLTAIQEWTGSVAVLTLRTAKTLTYDAWGNVLTEADAKNNVTIHTYDGLKRLFRLTTSNPLGHVEATSWNTGCQTPFQITDANLRVTTVSIDLFCREIRTDLPGGQYSITRYVAFGDPAQQHIEREKKSGSAAAGRTLSISREYYDGFGRIWLIAQPGTTSAIADAIITLSAFDPRGNLAWQSLPLPWSAASSIPSPAQRISFTYDGLDRLRASIAADGTQTITEFLTQSFSHFGDPVLTYPSLRTLDEHCFDANAANTICGEVFTSLDAADRPIRIARLDAGLTDVDASGQNLRATSYRYDQKGSLIAVTDPGGINFAYTYDVYGNRLTANDPGLGFWTLTYDANNNLLQQTDAKGQLISFAYDALNRVILKTVGTGPARVETRFSYDEVRAGFYNKGLETTQEVWTPAGTTHKVERDWHLMGGLAIERHMIDGRTYALETSFAPNGAPLDQKLPGTPGATTTDWIGPFTYDAAGRITAFTGFVSSVSYNAWGQPTNAAYANGVSESYAYNPARGWLTSVTGTLPGGNMAFRALYERSATGRIFRTDTQALVGGTPTDLGGAYDYAYDYTGRLLSATNWRGVTAFDQVFAYDKAGRIRLKGPTLAAAMTYDYSDPLTPDHAPSSVLAGGITTPFTYDANGNMLTGLGGKIMTYDGENRPLSVTHLGKRTCYVYGVDGKRLKKVEGLPPTQDCTALPANTNATVYFGSVEVRNWLVAGLEQVLTYPHPAVKLLNGTTPAVATYLHRDGLSSVRAITDAAGVKVESAVYKPFGEQSEWVLPGNTAPETKGWIGERFDADAGLQYLNARYYDPELSLFLQPDWFEVTKAGVGTNRFSYSFNDPINRSDPNGNQDAPSMLSKDEEEELEKKCANGCFSGRTYLEEMKDVCSAGGCATVAVALAPVAIYYAAVAAPTAYMVAMEVGVAEATGMVAGAGMLTKGAIAASEAALEATKRGATTGAAAAVETAAGEVVTGLSLNAAKKAKTERIVSVDIVELADESAHMLGGVASGCYGRNCAEVEAVSKAIAQGLDLAGSKIYAAYVGTRHGQNVAGEPMHLCGSCMDWTRSFGIRVGD